MVFTVAHFSCLFHKTYAASLSHPCLSLTTHITPSCHFVQDADGSVCVVGCVQLTDQCSMCCLFFQHELYVQEGSRCVSLNALLYPTSIALSLPTCVWVCVCQHALQVWVQVFQQGLSSNSRSTWLKNTGMKNQSITDSIPLSLFFSLPHVSQSQK